MSKERNIYYLFLFLLLTIFWYWFFIIIEFDKLFIHEVKYIKILERNPTFSINTHKNRDTSIIINKIYNIPCKRAINTFGDNICKVSKEMQEIKFAELIFPTYKDNGKTEIIQLGYIKQIYYVDKHNNLKNFIVSDKKIELGRKVKQMDNAFNYYLILMSYLILIFRYFYLDKGGIVSMVLFFGVILYTAYSGHIMSEY